MFLMTGNGRRDVVKTMGRFAFGNKGLVWNNALS